MAGKQVDISVSRMTIVLENAQTTPTNKQKNHQRNKFWKMLEELSFMTGFIRSECCSICVESQIFSCLQRLNRTPESVVLPIWHL